VIFVTVGTQGPFDRLIKAVDYWAGRTGRTDVMAQVGTSAYTPRHIQHSPFISPTLCGRYMADSQLIVSHAGMGSILSALELGKPILVMPRLASLGEHRSEHQLSTARHFRERGTIYVAMDEHELVSRLEAALTLETPIRIGPHASPELISRVRSFVENRAA
jgi:UDP-N-acetylglucosamine transferase subunit ALG13